MNNLLTKLECLLFVLKNHQNKGTVSFIKINMQIVLTNLVKHMFEKKTQKYKNNVQRIKKNQQIFRIIMVKDAWKYMDKKKFVQTIMKKTQVEKILYPNFFLRMTKNLL